jgi:acetylornithine deacetylase/succinyl-diaminopimelate desuccinylase-like protein
MTGTDADGSHHPDGGPPVAENLHERPVDLLRALVRFDTTNPPGDERACVEWVADVLDAYGVDTETYARDPDRPNLVARVEGGDAAPLLLYGHVDVVPAQPDDWTHPPFEAVVDDGFVWGRGTLDMKGGVAMMLATVLRVVHEDVDLAGDLVLAVLADEEDGGDDGARFLVDEHPELFEGVEYALGEFGGFTMDVAGERFFPIQVAEKQICWLELTFSGQGGHGSLPNDGDAMARMAAAVDALDGSRLPVHVTPPARELFEAVAAELSPPRSWVVRALLWPPVSEHLLSLLGQDGETFDALLHNTVNTTVVRGGDKENVVPAEVSLTLDVRVLPGYDADDAVAEVRDVVGDGPDVEVRRFDEGPPEPDMALFDHLAGVLEDSAGGGTAVPLLLSGATDARTLADLGIQSYGFTPLLLPDDFEFTSVVHAADERVPVDAVGWGADRLYEAVVDYPG